ncbi:MAG: histidine phosphatase family protein [Deltaproteobacteria bacterium]|nr:histidine phosphatase family protein [Deltaproteobacteria bacterium]
MDSEAKATIKRLYLLRHCKAEGQDSYAPLTAKGMHQANILADLMVEFGITGIRCSPFVRATSSIMPFSLKTGIPVTVDEELAERRLGICPTEDWKAALKATFENDMLAYPEGESSKTALERGRAALHRALTLQGATPLIVTHGNLLTLLLCSFDKRFGFDEWERMKSPALYLVETRGTISNVISMEEQCHVLDV